MSSFCCASGLCRIFILLFSGMACLGVTAAKEVAFVDRSILGHISIFVSRAKRYLADAKSL